MKLSRGPPAEPNVEDIKDIFRELGLKMTRRLMAALCLEKELEDVIEVIWPDGDRPSQTPGRRNVDLS